MAMSQSSINGGGEVVLYEAADGQIRLDVRLGQDKQVWLTQAQMAELFGKNVRTVSEHVTNIFKEKELDESSVIRNFRITAESWLATTEDCSVVQRKSRSRLARRNRSKSPTSQAKLPVTTRPSFVNGGGEVVFYEAADGRVQLDVRLERETVWLTQAQMAKLFGRERSVITKHVRGVFREGELEAKSVCANFARTAEEDGKTYQVDHYNLDVCHFSGLPREIQTGTQFRIWATRTLKDHLLRGYTLNEKRLRERGLGEIEQAVGLMARTLTANALVTDEGRAVLEVVQQYTRAWKLLLEYDEGRLAEKPLHPIKPATGLSFEDAKAVIARLRETLAQRGEATNLFGAERSDQLHGILGAIDQTFGGEPLYPTVQARAAHVLYFVIKDHPFADGNKRIGALLFLEYLRRNRMLSRADGRPRLANNAMVALALLVAESDPAQKDLMIRLILNLLEDGGG